MWAYLSPPTPCPPHCFLLVAQVPNPLDYAMVVKRIGNEMDMTTVDLEGVLPQTQIMVCVLRGSAHPCE